MQNLRQFPGVSNHLICVGCGLDVLKKITADIKPSVEYTQNIYVPIGSEQVCDPVMSVKQNASVEVQNSFVSIT